MSTAVVAGRYELRSPLGHGAMAVVDLAHDVELDRPVALKRLAENLARDEDLRARFVREARLAARLAHPNIVRIYDVGEDEGRPFIAMEHVDGETLAEVVARRGPLHPAEAAALGIQACRALAAAHAAGLVHRDVKPQNLLLHRDGTLKLGDFGVAVGLEGTRLTAVGTILGTAAYLAPEQARGEQVTAAADVYGLGAVLYELLAGRPPRTVVTLGALADRESYRIRDVRELAPRVSPELGEIVMRCLAFEPEDRPASAAELARALAAASPEAATLPLPDDSSLRATEILAAPVRPRARRRPRLTLVAAAVAALAIGAGVAAAELGGGPARRAPAAPAQIAPIAHAQSPAQEAQNLAAWLRRYSG